MVYFKGIFQRILRLKMLVWIYNFLKKIIEISNVIKKTEKLFVLYLNE